MSAYGRLKMWYLYVAENIIKCLFAGGDSLREVSVSEGLTALPLPRVWHGRKQRH